MSKRPALRRVNLNHAASAAVAGAYSHALLVLGLLSLGLALYTLNAMHQHKQALMAESDSLQQARLDMSSPNVSALASKNSKDGAKQSSEKTAELAEVNTARQALALPWEPLFAMLEGIQQPDIRILAIAPNAQKHTLRLTAEAASAEAMLAYLNTLSQQAILQDVVMQSHQYSSDGRALPFSFMVEAVWLN